jgi:tRNA nucleotidyltransferase (CCA-adding enzyme)
MPDYMFLLESRLSPEQRAVLERVQELARSQELNIYLTGGAVRDLISGQPIRDLDFTVEGNPVRMVRELEKGGARVLSEHERTRHYELIFAGDVDGSIAAARDDVYERPGTRPDYRFSGIMEDLRRRDFSVNAIAVSLNTQSRGLLLDPMNGLADLERQEVRALSIHAFTNQPIRLVRILRYAARMGFKIESRTQEWFDLAVERKLHEDLSMSDVGEEFRALTREDSPVPTLKVWESHGLLESIHPQLHKRKPDYDSLNKLGRVRINLYSAGIRPRLSRPVMYYVLGRLKPRDAASALRAMEFRSGEIETLGELVPEAHKIVQILKGRKTNAPKDAYSYIASLSGEMLAFIEVEFPNSPVLSKLHNYLQKWRPLRMGLPMAELDALGVPRGPKFDKIIDQVFEMQLRGRARTPEDRAKALRQLAGVKDEPKKKPEKEKKKRGDKPSAAPAPPPSGAKPQPSRQPAGNEPHAKSAAAAIGAKAQAKHAAAHVEQKPKSAAAKAKGKPGKKNARR